MAISVVYTPAKDFFDDNSYLLFESKWVAVHNPIVFKVQTGKFPTNSDDSAESYTSVEDDNGFAKFIFEDATVINPDWYAKGMQVTVTGDYAGTYTVRKYDPVNAGVTLNVSYLATGTGTIEKYYPNYNIKLKVFAGLTETHKWYGLNPIEEVQAYSSIPNSNNLAVFDIQEAVKTKVSTTNDIALISLPNDVNLWCSFLVSYAESYTDTTGETGTASNIEGYADDGNGFAQIAVDASTGVQAGGYIVLDGFQDSNYNGSVIRVKSVSNNGTLLVLDIAYDSGFAYGYYETAQAYDTTLTTYTSGYTEEGTEYYALNAKVGLQRFYGTNLAEYVVTDDPTVPPALLSNFTDKYYFDGKYDDLSAIIDDQLIASLSADEQIALEVKQYDVNGVLVDTQYYKVNNQDYGLYRFPYAGTLTKIQLVSLRFASDETQAISFPLEDEFFAMSVREPFSTLTQANLTYQYNNTDTWGSPQVSETDLTTFNAAVRTKTTGFIRIVTSETGYYDGGLLIQITSLGIGATLTTVSIDMPAGGIDQDILFYCDNFNISSVTSSAGDLLTFGAREGSIATDDYTSFGLSLTQMNNVLTTGFNAGHIFIKRTDSAARIITINGSHTDDLSRSYISVANSPFTDKTYRSALDNNAKVYDGTTDQDNISAWAEFDRDQPFTFSSTVERDSTGTFDILFSTQNVLAPTGQGIYIGFRNSGQIQVNISNNSNPALGALNDIAIITNTTYPAGKYNVIVCYDGLSNDDSLTFFVNGLNEPYTLLRPNTLTGTIINGQNTGTIGRSPAITASSYFDGLIRVMQILDTDYSANTELIRKAFLTGSFEGLVLDARFLLDVDFNQTGTNNLTTRAGTPSYTITATGGAAYTSFY
jgi:hypothetical protein